MKKKIRNILIVSAIIGAILISALLLTTFFSVIIGGSTPFCYINSTYIACNDNYANFMRNSFWSGNTNIQLTDQSFKISLYNVAASSMQSLETTTRTIASLHDFGGAADTIILYLDEISISASNSCSDNNQIGRSYAKLAGGSAYGLNLACTSNFQNSCASCEQTLKNVKINIFPNNKVDIYTNCENKMCEKGQLYATANMLGEPYFELYSLAGVGYNGRASSLASISYNSANWEACTDTSWLPLPSSICEGISFTQGSNCGRFKASIGTKICSGDSDPDTEPDQDQNYTQPDTDSDNDTEPYYPPQPKPISPWAVGAIIGGIAAGLGSLWYIRRKL